jgi:hypothetical protein
MPRGQPSNRKREAAISALITSGTFAEAAAKAKIGERTLRNWLRDPSFCAAYRRARAEFLEHSLAVMQGATISAVSVMLRAMSCGRIAIELRAADRLLERSVQAVEMFELIGRVEALEARLDQTPGGNHAYHDAQKNGQANGGPGR